MHDLITEGYIRQFERTRQEARRHRPVACKLATWQEHRSHQVRQTDAVRRSAAARLRQWGTGTSVAIGSWLERRVGSVAAS